MFACDAYAAMTTDRTYKRAMSDADALLELRRCAGTQFDEMVVEALCTMLAERRTDVAPVSPRGSAGHACA